MDYGTNKIYKVDKDLGEGRNHCSFFWKNVTRTEFTNKDIEFYQEEGAARWMQLAKVVRMSLWIASACSSVLLTKIYMFLQCHNPGFIYNFTLDLDF